MRKIFKTFLMGLFVAAGCGGASAVAPQVAGEIGGQVRLFDREPAFLLPWNLVLEHGVDGGQGFHYKIDVAGTKLAVSGVLDWNTRDGSWRIDECSVDAAVWLGLFAPKLGGVLAGTSAQGLVTVSGEGVLHRGEITGRLKCRWRDGALVHPEQGWKLEGITFNGEFAIDVVAMQLTSTEPFELKIGSIVHPRFGARNLRLNALITPQRSLRINDGQMEIAGGELFVDPAEVPLVPPAIDINLRFQRVGLQDIVMLVPTAGLSDARGRIDGVVRLKWSEANGLRLGVGRLSLRNDEPAIVRLSPSLGLLTARVPQYIDLFPAWMGSLGRRMRPENPAFGDLSNIELGKADLRVSRLDVQLTPEGDERGRSAKVQIVAEPDKPSSSVKKVTVDVNLAGSLDAVLKLGIEQNFSIDAH